MKMFLVSLTKNYAKNKDSSRIFSESNLISKSEIINNKMMK